MVEKGFPVTFGPEPLLRRNGDQTPAQLDEFRHDFSEFIIDSAPFLQKERLLRGKSLFGVGHDFFKGGSEPRQRLNFAGDDDLGGLTVCSFLEGLQALQCKHLLRRIRLV